MSPDRAATRTNSAGQVASHYTLYSRFVSLLERNRQAAWASRMRVEAIEEFDEADLEDHSLFLRLVHDQLAIYREQRNHSAIDELHCNVVGRFHHIFGHEHWRTVTAMHEYGQMLCGEKRYEQAEALYRTLVDEVDQDRGSELVPVLCIFNALGAVYPKRRKLKEAEAILVRAVVGFQRQCGDRDPRTLTAAFNFRLGLAHGCSDFLFVPHSSVPSQCNTRPPRVPL